MVVHVVLSFLEVSVYLEDALEATRVKILSPRRRSSSTRGRQSRLSRQSGHGFDVLVILAPRCHRGLRHRDVVRIHLLDHTVRL